MGNEQLRDGKKYGVFQGMLVPSGEKTQTAKLMKIQ